MTEWQPIETAPIGKPVLVWDDYWLMRIAVLDIVKRVWITDAPCAEDHPPIFLSPTHWMHLPATPK